MISPDLDSFYSHLISQIQLPPEATSLVTVGKSHPTSARLGHPLKKSASCRSEERKSFCRRSRQSRHVLDLSQTFFSGRPSRKVLVAGPPRSPVRTAASRCWSPGNSRIGVWDTQVGLGHCYRSEMARESEQLRQGGFNRRVHEPLVPFPG